MTSEVLGDRFGSMLGVIEDEGRRLILKDRFGNVLGYYDKSNKFTFDRVGRVFGRGNWLSTLLYIELGGKVKF